MSDTDRPRPSTKLLALAAMTCRPGPPRLNADELETHLATLSGCGTLYLAQAANGQMHVLNAQRPIDKVVADPGTPPPLRTRLMDVSAARDFAVTELHLPDNRSYRTYADVKRPYVVWNVVATPEFSVEPKHWCFPIAGCVAQPRTLEAITSSAPAIVMRKASDSDRTGLRIATPDHLSITRPRRRETL